MTTGLSFAERQLWLVDQRDPQAYPFIDCARSLSIVARLGNALDQQAFVASLNGIVRRHDVLRSRFVVCDGRLQRQCEPSQRIDLVPIDLQAMRPGDRRDALTQILTDDLNGPFDLAAGPLLRATLVTLAPDHYVLAMTVHHIVFDRWSRRVLAQELSAFYSAETSGRTPQLEPLPMQYADYVQWQRERLEGNLGQMLLEHWTTRLRGLTDLRLPADGVRGHAVSTRSGTCWFTIPASDAARLAAMSRRIRGTVTTVLLAVLKLLLYRVSGVDDLVVGVPLSDRRRPEFEPMIGLFMNAVPVRTTVPRGMSFLDLLDRTRGALVEACRYQDMPFGYLLQALGAQTPLFRVLFNFMPAIPESGLDLAGLRVEPMTMPAEHESLADLSVHARQESDGTLRCRLVYKADLFSPARMQDLAAQFQWLVTAILDEPQKCIDAYDVAPAGQH